MSKVNESSVKVSPVVVPAVVATAVPPKVDDSVKVVEPLVRIM
jgi:hypothetical protein